METKRSVVEAMEREDRVFIRVPRKKRTLRIPITYSSTEAVAKEDPPKAESSKRNSKKRPLLVHPLEQQPKKPKRKANGRFDDAGASSSGETKEPTPEWLLRLIRSKNGENPKKILNKGLTASDVDFGKHRLSIPLSKIVDEDFLNPAEERVVDLQYRKILKTGVDATLVASDLREFELNLRLWPMGNTHLFNLVSGWNDVVKNCRLKENDQIRLWSFHANDKLYFAFVPLLPPLIP
ncbi:B3 domain-containing protein [Cardamine amara subsp. amara]|uniref:B3 domain-containing protein n=1 Tax=Cardamine amara subsp. amara TaxID=228776 RepID=A0ABD1B5V1_CARAN